MEFEDQGPTTDKISHPNVKVGIGSRLRASIEIGAALATILTAICSLVYFLATRAPSPNPNVAQAEKTVVEKQPDASQASTISSNNNDIVNPQVQDLIKLASTIQPPYSDEAKQIQSALKEVTPDEEARFTPSQVQAKEDLNIALSMYNVQKRGLAEALDKTVSVGVTSGPDRRDLKMAEAVKDWLAKNGYNVDQQNPVLLIRVRLTQVTSSAVFNSQEVENDNLTASVTWRWNGHVTQGPTIPPITGSGIRESNSRTDGPTIYETLAESLASVHPL